MASKHVEYPITAEEFLARPRARDAREELVRGFVVREPLPRPPHGIVVARLCELLRRFVRERGLAGVVIAEVGFVVARNPDHVCGPDVSYVSKERLGPAMRIEGGADLAIEVLSPGDRPGEIGARIADQFHAGARLCWVVDPRARKVVMHRPDGTRITLSGDAPLDGGDVLPGLDVPARAVFED